MREEPEEPEKHLWSECMYGVKEVVSHVECSPVRVDPGSRPTSPGQSVDEANVVSMETCTQSPNSVVVTLAVAFAMPATPHLTRSGDSPSSII